MEFYQKLQKIRKENGMSQEELAGHLGVSRQSVSKWENDQGFPETDKLVAISTLFSVSLDYLLKEERDQAGENGETVDDSYYASRETVETYLSSRRQNGRQFVLGIAIMILAFVFPLLMQSAAGEPLNDRMDGLAFVLMFATLGGGLAVMLTAIFRPKRYPEELETKPLLFDSGFIREFRTGYPAVRKKAGHMIVAGILCILAGILLTILPEALFGREDARFAALLFVAASVAVPLIIRGAGTMDAYSLIAQNEKHLREQKEENEGSGRIYAVLMPLAVIAFLAIGFLWDAWHPGWLVFPAAALLGTAINALVQNK